MSRTKVVSNKDVERSAYNEGAKLGGTMRSVPTDYSAEQHKKERNRQILEAFNRFKVSLKDADKGKLSDEELAKKFLEGWQDAFFDDPK